MVNRILGFHWVLPFTKTNIYVLVDKIIFLVQYKMFPLIKLSPLPWDGCLISPPGCILLASISPWNG